MVHQRDRLHHQIFFPYPLLGRSLCFYCERMNLAMYRRNFDFGNCRTATLTPFQWSFPSWAFGLCFCCWKWPNLPAGYYCFPGPWIRQRKVTAKLRLNGLAYERFLAFSCLKDRWILSMSLRIIFCSECLHLWLVLHVYFCTSQWYRLLRPFSSKPIRCFIGCWRNHWSSNDWLHHSHMEFQLIDPWQHFLTWSIVFSRTFVVDSPFPSVCFLP